MAPYEALYSRPCCSPLCWAEKEEVLLVGPELVQQTIEKIKVIRERLYAAQSRQKSYADKRRRLLEFVVRDFVFLKVVPYKGIFRFGKKGKLAPRLIRPFKMVQKVGTQAYRLALPHTFAHVHDVFHVSMLRKYHSDSSHVVKWHDLHLQEDASYLEQPIQVLDWKANVLRNKTIPLVKVLWRHHEVEEATWELKSDMRDRFPHLFHESDIFLKIREYSCPNFTSVGNQILLELFDQLFENGSL
ncbi:uncharacterized protein LOC132304754 [Cornus florida]|uniref:uncharacterized protein LOC132304754 n=1 Tax=Cornus florida TaxID=4283 RepID=UPI00289E0A27|nr:uncharacterized protein LOC132304754 [Cornus florida]